MFKHGAQMQVPDKCQICVKTWGAFARCFLAVFLADISPIFWEGLHFITLSQKTPREVLFQPYGGNFGPSTCERFRPSRRPYARVRHVRHR